MTMTNDRIRVHGVELLSLQEAARTLRVHTSMIYKLVQEGSFKIAYKANRKRYVKSEDVAAYRTRRDGWLRLHGRRVPARVPRQPVRMRA